MPRITRLLLMFIAVLLNACSSAPLESYQATTPIFKPETFFEGELKAYGIVLDRNGSLTRRFTVDIDASWSDGVGEIKEWFVYDDGEKATRTWIMTKQPDGTYTGTAGDVIGEASGAAAGSVFYWRYDLTIQVDGDDLTVTLDDWMYLVTESKLLNKSDIIKFGFKVGEVILVIERV